MGTDVGVTVIGGFLGAGKTTLVNHLVRSITGRRVAVLVNDFGDLEVDKNTIIAAEDDIISLANGCICCSMRSGVLSTVYRLLERRDPPEHLVVEASGVSDPRTLADLFIDAEKTGAVRLDGLISVVDAERFDPSDALARAQVQATDIVVLNKTDLVPRSRIEEVREQVRAAAETARIVEAIEGVVPVDLLLGAGAEAARLLGPVHGIDASRFTAWTYVNPKPASFRRLLPALSNLPPDVYRAKGIVNLIERDGQEVAVQIVGRRLWVKTVGPWAAGEARTALVMIGEAATVDFDKLGAELDELIAT